MDKRVWGMVIVILGLVLIAGIVYLIFFYKFSPPAEEANLPVPQSSAVTQNVTQPSTLATTTAPAEEPATSSVQPVSPLKQADVSQEDLARMASAFAERYGSYSNQSDYGNIRDLLLFMTSSMKTWAENYIVDARTKKGDTSIYYGIVTKAIATIINQFDADTGQAEILVRTQRRESTGVSGNSLTFYQDIIIKFLRQSGVWRVDGIYWQSR